MSAKKSADEAFAKAYRRAYDEATANGPIPDDDMQRVRDEANRAGMEAEARELERAGGGARAVSPPPLLVIDPPVGPYHPPDELRAWIARLEEMRVEHAGVEGAIEVVERSLEEARRWLEGPAGGER